MANVVLRIETNPNASEEMLGTITNYDSADVGTNDNVANTSIKANESGVYSGIENASGEGSNGLTWAYEYENSEDNYLVFNDQDYVDNVENSDGYLESETNPTQFVWGVVPENKQYYVKLTFSNATKLKDIVIKGDEISNQFATRAIIDGTKEIFSDDSNWAIMFDEEKDTHTIELTHWNKPKLNAIISKITILNRYIEFDKRQIKSINALSQTTPNAESIFYGIVPNRADANILDTTGELLDYSSDNIFSQSSLPCNILVNGEMVQTGIIENSEYGKMSKTLKIEMIGSINPLRLVVIGFSKSTGIGMDKKSIRDVLKEALLYAGIINPPFTDFEEMLQSKVFVDGVGLVEDYYESLYDYLGKIYIRHYAYYRSASSVYELVEKICQATQMVFFETKEGKLVFLSARPRMFRNQKVVNIPIKSQFGAFDEASIVKNRYDSVYYRFKTTKPSISTVFSTTYSLKDSNEQFSIEQVPESTVKTFNGQDFLCMFVTVSSSSNCFATNVSFEQDGVYPFFGEIKSGDISSKSGIAYILDANSSITKTDYDFSELATIKRLPYYSTLNSDVFAIMLPINTSEAESVSLDIVARVSQHSSREEKYYDNGISTYDFAYDNEFIGNSTVYYLDLLEEKQYLLYDFIFTSIVNDYKSGIRSAKISVACMDYYDINGNLAIDWNKNELIDIGDIVRIEKDNEGNSISKYADGTDIIWKIVGRNFRKEGVPLIDLELQEVKKAYFDIPSIKIVFSASFDNNVSNILIERDFTLTNEGLGVLYSTRNSTPTNATVFAGDKIRITIKPKWANLEMTELKINNEEYSNGSVFSVPDNIPSIFVSAKFN